MVHYAYSIHINTFKEPCGCYQCVSNISHLHPLFNIEAVTLKEHSTKQTASRWREIEIPQIKQLISL